jgi:hypothetical protein
MSLIRKIKNKLRAFVLRPQQPINVFIIGQNQALCHPLWTILKQYNEVALATVPECHFFDQKSPLFQPLAIDSYHRLFQFKKHKKIVVDVTSNYFYWQTTPRRIYEYNRKAKIIVVLQNPIERAYAHWEYNKSLNMENLSFEEALHAEEERARNCLPFQDVQFGYTQMGYYSESIRRYQRYFKDHNLLFITYDELFNEAQATLTKIALFLHIKPVVVEKPLVLESNCSITLETHQKLLDRYYFDMQETERLLQKNLLTWFQQPQKKKYE